MKSTLLAILTLFFLNTSVSVAAGVDTPSANDKKQFEDKVNEIRSTGLKPTDENIYNMCFASSLLLINAANDAVSGQYSGDKDLGELLLIDHNEYRDIVKGLVKTGGVMDIKNNPDAFDESFQMKCRASPEEYIKNYKNIFRVK